MKKLRRLWLVVLCAVAVAIGSAGPTNAQLGGIVFDPTNHATALANEAQTIAQLIQQATTLKNQLNALQSGLSPAVVTQLLNDRNAFQQQFQQLGSLLDKGLQVPGAEVSTANTFSTFFPAFTAEKDYVALYQTWAANTRQAAARQIQTGGLVDSQSSATFAQQMANLAQQANTPQDISKATQVGNNIALAAVEQLEKLKQLQSAQAQSESAFYANYTASSAAAGKANDLQVLRAWASLNTTHLPSPRPMPSFGVRP